MALGGRRRAAAPAIYKLCSLLLSYPDDELLAARTDELRAARRRAAGLAPPPTALARFCAWWTRTEPLALAQHYVETFDLHKRSGLYLTFYGRGRQARARAAHCCASSGCTGPPACRWRATELPDFLPVMLEFAAAAPDGRGEIVLREHRAALELLRLQPARAPAAPTRTCSTRSCLTLGEPSAADRARVGAAGRERPAAGAGRPRAVRARPRSCRRRRRGDERRRDPAVDHPPVRRAHGVRRRALVALPPRPVRVDEPLDPAAGPARPRLGQPGLPLRGAGRGRRAHASACASPRPGPTRSGSARAPTAGSPAIAGGVAGAVTLVGFVGLVYRRATSDRVRRSTTADRPASPTCCSRC